MHMHRGDIVSTIRQPLIFVDFVVGDEMPVP